MYMYVYVYKYICIHMYIYIHIYIYVCMCVCVYRMIDFGVTISSGRRCASREWCLSVVAPLLALCACVNGLFYCRVRVGVTC